MTKRNSVSFIYFSVIIMTLLVRVTTALGLYDSLGVEVELYFTLLAQVFCFGIWPAFLYLAFVNQKGKNRFLGLINDFGFKRAGIKNWFRALILGICMIVIATNISLVWQILLEVIGYKRVSSPTEYDSLATLFVQLTLVALLPGIFEELTHRGLLFAGYHNTGWKYVFVSALLFALMHQNITQTLYTFIDGIVIACVMYYTRSIWLGMFMHVFNNGIAVIGEYASQVDGPLNFISVARKWIFSSIGGLLIYVAIGMLCLLITIFILHRMKKDAVKKGFIKNEPLPRGDKDALPLRKDAFFILTVLVGIAATAFSLVWGIMR